MSVPLSNPDAPARVDVPMARDRFDRLTGHDDAPRCRYAMATGRAGFVPAPTLSHHLRRRASEVTSNMLAPGTGGTRAAGHGT